MRISAPTLVELLAKVYALHGWTRARGESRTKRVAALYDVRIEGRRFVATPKA